MMTTPAESASYIGVTSVIPTFLMPSLRRRAGANQQVVLQAEPAHVVAPIQRIGGRQG